MQAEDLLVLRLNQISASLQEPDELELLDVAARLRQILTDEHRLITAANRRHRLKIRFAVQDVVATPPSPKPMLHYFGGGLIPGSTPTQFPTRELTLDEFLSCTLATVEGKDISIHDVIKYAANKEGGVHLDLRRDESSRRDESARRIDRAQQLARGFHIVASALRDIAVLTLRSLRPLRDEIVRLPTDIPLLARYSTGHAGTIAFTGGQCLRGPLPHDLAAGFGLATLARVTAGGSEQVLYEVAGGGDGARSSVALLLTAENRIAVRLQLPSGLQAMALAPLGATRAATSRFTYIAASVHSDAGATTVDLFISGTLVATASIAVAPGKSAVEEHQMGCSLDGQHPATGEMSEVIVTAIPLDADRVRAIGRSIVLRFHR